MRTQWKPFQFGSKVNERMTEDKGVVFFWTMVGLVCIYAYIAISFQIIQLNYCPIRTIISSEENNTCYYM